MTSWKRVWYYILLPSTPTVCKKTLACRKWLTNTRYYYYTMNYIY